MEALSITGGQDEDIGIKSTEIFYCWTGHRNAGLGREALDLQSTERLHRWEDGGDCKVTQRFPAFYLIMFNRSILLSISRASVRRMDAHPVESLHDKSACHDWARPVQNNITKKQKKKPKARPSRADTSVRSSITVASTFLCVLLSLYWPAGEHYSADGAHWRANGADFTSSGIQWSYYCSFVEVHRIHFSHQDPKRNHLERTHYSTRLENWCAHGNSCNQEYYTPRNGKTQIGVSLDFGWGRAQSLREDATFGLGWMFVYVGLL